MIAKFRVKWIDDNREPQCTPDPNYPNGIDLDISEGKTPYCSSDLPYPARRCGFFMVECMNCGQIVGVTTAGRPDDPRSIKMACQGSRTVLH
jgi:hypothetical protein